ncbi:MAG: bifunctional 3-deoxy-7-phosphoheptulonate synthase/chorismate mutase [Candidatus Cloacimonetes bacterium]|nr:bifunctional 3-deoxy-7-phosphoheptulonate synthase/chorismate mutase [Candidatus Cloacimonadota bacterium]
MLVKLENIDHLQEITDYLNRHIIDFQVYRLDKDIFIHLERLEDDDVLKKFNMAEKVFFERPNSRKRISLNDTILFQENDFNIIAGPCAVESEDYLIKTAQLLVKHKIKMIRGGANKLRTSPYSFQGLGNEGISLLSKIAKEYYLFSVSEITSLQEIDLIEKHIDIVLLGTRNMHNYQLLKELGQVNKPVILKRGMAATVKEWLLAAEYIKLNGNPNIILCERGIRTFETCLRNTFDLASAVYVSQNYDYIVITDPSHATGNKNLVEAMTLASLVAKTQGAMIEIHPEPEKSLSDGEQMLNFQQFERLMENIKTFSKG